MDNSAVLLPAVQLMHIIHFMNHLMTHNGVNVLPVRIIQMEFNITKEKINVANAATLPLLVHAASESNSLGSTKDTALAVKNQLNQLLNGWDHAVSTNDPLVPLANAFKLRSAPTERHKKLSLSTVPPLLVKFKEAQLHAALFQYSELSTHLAATAQEPAEQEQARADSVDPELNQQNMNGFIPTLLVNVNSNKHPTATTKNVDSGLLGHFKQSNKSSNVTDPTPVAATISDTVNASATTLSLEHAWVSTANATATPKSPPMVNYGRNKHFHVMLKPASATIPSTLPSTTSWPSVQPERLHLSKIAASTTQSHKRQLANRSQSVQRKYWKLEHAQFQLIKFNIQLHAAAAAATN
jgi:hypothetical protein